MKIIKTLSIMIGIFLVLLMVPAVLGAENIGKIQEGNNLIITEVEVEVDGDDTTYDSPSDYGDTIGDDIKPDSNVEIKVEGMNNFTSSEDLDIEDIEVEIIIENIDDGEDLEFDDEELDDLRYGKDDTVKIEFDVPLRIEDDEDYLVTITIRGEDENRTDHEVQFEFYLHSDKERNEVVFTKNSLVPSEITCGSRSVKLTSSVMNLGRDDEDDVVLEVTNAELGISKSVTFDLSSDPDDDEYEVTKSFNFVVPDDVATGTYQILSRITYDDGGETDEEVVDLTVLPCQVVEEEPEVECETDNDCGANEVCEDGECVEAEVVVVQPPVTEEEDETVTPPVLPAAEEESLFETSGVLIALIVGEALLVIIAILIVIAVLRKKGG